MLSFGGVQTQDLFLRSESFPTIKVLFSFQFVHSICMQRTLHIDNLKVEKDNACDKMDACEEAMKTAKVRFFYIFKTDSWILFLENEKDS